MKSVFIAIVCLNVCACLHAQGVTLLYKNNLGWNDPLSWIQINTPTGQTPLQRVPTELDDVVINSSLSGIYIFPGFIADAINTDFFVGSNNTVGYRCRSMHISNTDLSFDSPTYIDGAATLNVYTANGGYVIIDSGANVHRGHFLLHGGNPAITDLQILHSSYGTLFSHARWSSLSWDVGGRARLIGSTLSGTNMGSTSGGNIFIDSCIFNAQVFTLGDNSIDTILHCLIQDDITNLGLTFLIGRNAEVVSDSVQIEPTENLSFTTSGSVINGNIISHYIPGNMFFQQEDTAHPLPNILNGSLVTGEAEYYSFMGDLKISGDFICNGSVDAFNDGQSSDTAEVYVNGQPIFEVGGILNFAKSVYVSNCAQGYCHYKLEFFGNKNSNIHWPGGFPVDTLIINKSGCAKVTCDNSLYVAGATRIVSGQLALDPNDSLPYKFVCAGNVDIAQGGGLFLRRDAAGVVANIAVGGTLTDHNAVADSTCAGLSNPYGGTITFYSPLPLTLLDFKGRYAGKEVTLNWSTEAEINTKYFTIEKSLDQVSFVALANVKAAGNTLAHIYSYTDKSSLSSINYYRLKMADADGRFTYSRIIAVKAPANNAIVIFPNPARDKLFIRLAGITQQTAITINDAKGRCIKKLQLSAGTIQTSVNTAGLVAGVYSISFLSGTLKYTRQFIKQ